MSGPAVTEQVVAERLEQAFREERSQVLATLIRVTGDWEVAEECVQEAFAAALRHWPVDGIPDRPGAWLTTTARRRAIDWLRREAVGAAKLREVAVMTDRDGGLAGPDGTPASAGDEPSAVQDDLLRLMFTCCHPALALETRVALTLRTLAGLSTAEIARAFLVGEDAMSKRLTRAKQKIKHAGIPYRVPPDHLLPERTPAVLAVLYLLFNEGYSATAGADLVRSGLANEAIRLSRLLVRLMPDEPEAAGLLALMLLHNARRDTRTQRGELVTLEDQDRSRWRLDEVTEGTEVLEAALRRRRPGPYQIQAAIAACHATAPTAAETDWPQIAALYGQLKQTPVVQLNRTVAIGMADGPAVGLKLLDQLQGLDGYYLVPATRADFLRRLGRTTEAAAAYRAALELVKTAPEQAYLKRRLKQLSG
ncbi:putative RNA polymerase, sigma-24 subunit, ECF subfamily [Kribbella flavida DSM 17836]|uniref:Putative RNA polymerase, sigma-24 subunit, ECF subfamily n=1 Tax=Kribbella flavida (strain DSM 17836 / JCM 10339 / NBRC 14399) TaxID=479435 RepID=D2Q3G8_KRIFD|nr:putative RNA polymerase, sigma-24 subunit, ECF subfamily [Kribbella flavida DSM 17836]